MIPTFNSLELQKRTMKVIDDYCMTNFVKRDFPLAYTGKEFILQLENLRIDLDIYTMRYENDALSKRILRIDSLVRESFREKIEMQLSFISNIEEKTLASREKKIYKELKWEMWGSRNTNFDKASVWIHHNYYNMLSRYTYALGYEPPPIDTADNIRMELMQKEVRSK